MSTISAVSPAVPARPADAAGAPSPSRVPQKTLKQDDFMKLLAVQFQMQDPMKPMEDTAFIAQSAQFAALEQSTAMTRQLAELRSEQQRASANGYLGRHVTVDAGEGRTISGTVAGVEFDAEQPRLRIGADTYPLSAVLVAESAAPSLPAPAPVPGDAP